MDRDALFFDDGSFAAPLFVRDILEVPETHRDWYRATGKTGKQAYRLTEHIWKSVREPFERQYMEIEAARDVMVAKREADLAAIRKQNDDTAIDRALTRVLVAAGVKEGLIGGAIALLREGAAFEVEKGYQDEIVIMAKTPDGFLHSLDLYAKCFLDSDDGAGFRSANAGPGDSYFTDLVAGLKQRR
jgi:hypothetical protein